MDASSVETYRREAAELYTRLAGIPGQLGVLGGGQLGRMLLPPARRLNIEPIFLDPDPGAPCAEAGQCITGDFRDFATVETFGKSRALLTTEIEHVNTEALASLAADGVVVRPSAEILALVQDKLKQKQFYEARGVPTAPFVAAENRRELIARFEAGKLNAVLPGVQKLRRSGYDGRGVQVLPEQTTTGDAAGSPLYKFLHTEAFDAPSFIEAKVPFEKEIAVIVARNAAGDVATYPAVEMEFHPTANLVELLFAPAAISAEVLARADGIARELAEALRLEGLLAVELFVLSDGQVLVNEIAPRTHNSGHHTIEACVTSQFEQHLRAIIGLPPGSTDLYGPAAMVNLLGGSGSGPAQCRGISELLALSGVHLHLYGKRSTRPLRKMGHATVTCAAGRSPDQTSALFTPEAQADVRERARQIRERFEIHGTTDAQDARHSRTANTRDDQGQ